MCARAPDHIMCIIPEISKCMSREPLMFPVINEGSILPTLLDTLSLCVLFVFYREVRFYINEVIDRSFLSFISRHTFAPHTA